MPRQMLLPYNVVVDVKTTEDGITEYVAAVEQACMKLKWGGRRIERSKGCHQEDTSPNLISQKKRGGQLQS